MDSWSERDFRIAVAGPLSRRQAALAPRRLAPFGTALLERLRGHLGIPIAKDVRMIDGIDANHAAFDHVPASLLARIARRQRGDTRAEDKGSRYSNLSLREH